MSGTVYLVGAGPGAPDLLTLRAARLLADADIVFYDALVHPETVALAERAQKIAVGKRCGKHSTAQRFINKRLVDAARRHRVVVRLKGGDPMLFGRAQEEISALEGAGIACEVVPGITAALAAAAELRTSLTQRGSARSVTFATPRVGVDVDPHARRSRGFTAPQGGGIRALGRPGGANVDPHARRSRGFAAPQGGGIRALGRPGGANVDPHARRSRGFAAPQGGGIRALGRPGGANVDEPDSSWASGLAAADAGAIYMGIGESERIAQTLLAAGKAPGLPVAIVESASLPGQRIRYTTLADLPRFANETVTGPALILIGPQFRARAAHAASSEALHAKSGTG